MAKQKRHNGYLVKTFTFNGKRIYIYAKTPQELTEKEFAKREELKKGVEAVYNPSLDDYYKHFTDVRKSEVKESTLRSQKIQYNVIADVKLSTGVAFGGLKIKDITRRIIEDVRQKLLEEGKTPQYLNNCFAHLNHVFNNAVLDDTIPKNPCKALKQLKRNVPSISENKHRALSEVETKQFFKIVEQENSFYKNAFLLMVKSGMRIGEVTALYRSDIDRINGYIHIRRTVTRDETGGYIISDDTKTKSGERDIPLTDDIYTIIKAQESQNRMLFGLKENGLLFPSVEGKILREYTINREIKRLCKKAGINEFTCHSFRNTFATRFIEQRPQDYKILSEIMGHKDIAITLNLYTHVMSENKVKAMNEICVRTS